MTQEQVRYGNGVVEPVLGIVLLDFTLQTHSFSTPAYVLHGEGPALILGFPFLRAQGILLTVMGDAYYPNRKEEQSRVCHQRCNPVQQLFGLKDSTLTDSYLLYPVGSISQM